MPGRWARHKNETTAAGKKNFLFPAASVNQFD
jgi:hypothetical protein